MILKGFWACAVAVLTASSVAAQQAAQSPPIQDAKATVSIGETAAPPGWELSVPVSVTVAEGAHVGRLSMRLVYPAKQVRYVSVKPSDTLKSAGFDVKAAAPKLDGETASITLEIQPADKGATVLTSGVAAILLFKVSEDAEEKSWPLTAEDVQAWGPGPQSVAVKAASAGPATFVVSPSGLPIFACFFYMH